MHPTEQLTLAYLLAAEQYPVGTTTVAVPTDYDFLLTDITGLTGGSEVSSAYLTLADGAAPIGLEFASTGGGVTFAPAMWHGLIPLPAGSSLTVTVLGGPVYLALSGWLLTPTAAQILPS